MYSGIANCDGFVSEMNRRDRVLSVFLTGIEERSTFSRLVLKYILFLSFIAQYHFSCFGERRETG